MPDLIAGLRRPGFVWRFPAVVDRVIDGDSVECHVLWHADEESHGVNVRVQGINAIEPRQRFGPEAAAALADLLPSGTPLTLHHTRADKYSGRFLARIERLPDGLDVAAEMLTKRAPDGTPLAVPYDR